MSAQPAALVRTRAPFRRRAISARLAAGIVPVLALAAGLRLIGLGAQSLWFDELWVAWAVGHRWPDLFAVLRSTDTHPPLYYALMKVWTGVAGTGEAALRFPSACLGVAAVALTYLLVRRVASETVALLSALVMAVSPFAITAAREARMYPLLTVLVLSASLLLMSAVAQRRVWLWGGYAMLATLIVYTHYLGALVLVSHGVWVAGADRRRLGAWAAAVAVAALLFVPWIPALADQLRQVHQMYAGGQWFRMKSGALDPTEVAGLLAFGGSLFGLPGYLSGGTAGFPVTALVVAPFLALLVLGGAALAGRPRALGALALPMIVVLGVAFAASLASAAVFPRWFSFLEPFYAALLAAGIAGAAPRPHPTRLALLSLGVVLSSAAVLEPYYARPDARPYQWRAAAAVVRAQLDDAADVLVYAGWQPYIGLRYYLGSGHPSLVVLPATGGSGIETVPSLDVPGRLALRFRRAWVVVTVPRTPDDPFVRTQLLPRFAKGFRPALRRDFGGLWVYRFDAR